MNSTPDRDPRTEAQAFTRELDEAVQLGEIDRSGVGEAVAAQREHLSSGDEVADDPALDDLAERLADEKP